MRFHIFKWAGLVLLIFAGVVSCTKYEEGPAVSFRFKSTRLDGTWKFEKFEMVRENGQVEDVISNGKVNPKSAYVVFTKGGSYEMINETEGHFGKEFGHWSEGKSGGGTIEIDKLDRLIQYDFTKLGNDRLKYSYKDHYPTDENEMVQCYIELSPRIL